MLLEKNDEIESLKKTEKKLIKSYNVASFNNVVDRIHFSGRILKK